MSLRLHRCLALALCTGAVGLLPGTAHPSPALATTTSSGGEGAPACARVVTTTISGTAPVAGSPCWVQESYPFVSEGLEGEGRSTRAPSKEPCNIALKNEETCYQTVTSMAFKGWDNGRAVTSEGPGNPKMVWRYAAGHWSPDSAFLAQRSNCTGEKIISAGGGDYWLIDATPKLPGQPWPSLCRFDRESGEWGEVPIPASTKERLEYVKTETREGVVVHEERKTRVGAITSGACFAWNDCWFFGSYGVVLHWSEVEEAVPALREASTPALYGLISGGEFLAAAASEGPAGEEFGLAVGGISEGGTTATGAEERIPLQGVQGGEPPAQLYSSIGGAFSPVAFNPPTVAQPESPYDTKLVAVAVDPAGQGWVAGQPALEPKAAAVVPAPLVPVTDAGAASGCERPPLFSAVAKGAPAPAAGAASPAGSFSWTSLGEVPSTGEAIAGGEMRRTQAETVAGDPSEDTHGEPVIAQASCSGTTTLTRFRANELALGGTETQHSAPADREGELSGEGTVSAVAAIAPNDAWAATGFGTFASGEKAPPHLYRLTNGLTPEAEAGNDDEGARPKREPKEKAPTPEATPPPPPPPAPTTTTTKRTIRLPAAVYDVRSKLHTSDAAGHVTLSLYITFKLRRAVTIGAHALRKGKLVSVARPKHFAGHSGTLVLVLNRAHWPTKVTFVT